MRWSRRPRERFTVTDNVRAGFIATRERHHICVAIFSHASTRRVIFTTRIFVAKRSENFSRMPRRCETPHTIDRRTRAVRYVHTEFVATRHTRVTIRCNVDDGNGTVKRIRELTVADFAGRSRARHMNVSTGSTRHMPRLISDTGRSPPCRCHLPGRPSRR